MNETLQQEETALTPDDGTAGKSRKKKFSFGGKKDRQGKRKLKKKWIVLIIVVLAAIAAAVVLKLRAGSKSTTAVTYTEAAVETKTITQSLSSSGTLQPANSYTVTTLVEGEILSGSFEEGDTVEEGTVLYTIDSSDVSSNIEKAQISLDQAQRNYESAADNANVKATVAGTVYDLTVSVGDTVQQGATIATVRNSSTMKLTVNFPSDDAAKFYVGETAAVTLDSTFETLTGTVTQVSSGDTVLTGNMLVRSVTIAVKNPGAITDATSASATIAGVSCAASANFAYTSSETVTAAASGTVTAVKAPSGTKVSKDQTIITLGGDSLDDQIQSAEENLKSAQISMQNTQDQLDNYTITSPISGTIVDKQSKIGDKVSSGGTLCTIYDLSYLEMTMSIDELDISQVSVGQTVSITADAVDGKTYTGQVTKVSVAGTTSNGTTTYPVTVRIDETDGLLPGMNVNAEIVVQEADNVLSIPSAAVNRGNTVLITSDSPSASNALDQTAPDGYVYVSVETGVSDDSSIEITSGLQSGDTVAYVKATSDDSSSTDMMMGGGIVAGGSGEMPSGGGGAPSGGGGAPSGGGGGGPVG